MLHVTVRPEVLDEPSIVDAVSTALRYEGYEVTEASTGFHGGFGGGRGHHGP